MIISWLFHVLSVLAYDSKLHFSIILMWIMVLRHKIVIRIKRGIMYKAPMYVVCRWKSVDIIIISCFIFVVFVNYMFVLFQTVSEFDRQLSTSNTWKILSYKIHFILLPYPLFPFSPVLLQPLPFHPLPSV